MKRIFVALPILAMLFSACVKNPIPYVPPVNENFEWKTTEPVLLNIPLESGTKSSLIGGEQQNNLASTVKIYSSALYSESSLIASGAAYKGMNFETVVDLARGIEQVFVKIVSPNGLVTLTTYDVVGNKAVKSESATILTKASISVPKPSFVQTYDKTINSVSDLPATFTESKTYFIPQGKEIKTDNANLFANWQQSNKPVLYVKGTLIMDNTSVTPLHYSSIVVLNGGNVVFKGRVNLGSTTAGLLAIYVQNGGKLVMQSGFDVNVKGVSIVNEGNLIVDGNPSILTAGSLLYNTGELESFGKIEFSGVGTTCHNNGKITIDDIALNSGANFYNYNNGNNLGKIKTNSLEMDNDNTYLYQHGFFTVEGEFSAKGKIDNYGKLECGTITDGTTVNFNSYKGSLIKATYLSKLINATFNMEGGSIIFIYKNGNGNGNTDNYNVKFLNDTKGEQEYALVLWGVDDNHPDNTIINKSDNISFSGNIENYCPKKNDAQNEKYTEDYCKSNAYWGGRDHHIDETIYNEGLGNKEDKDPIDADGDGVPEGEDVDDNDPTVTHVSYFPSAETWGTYFFEDLWPFIGDYDMNDVVLGFRIAYYSKGALSASNNNVVYMDVKWKLRAVGSQMKLAFGIQLDQITPNMVASIENDNTNLASSPINTDNKGMESGQSKAVFALFNNPAEIYGISTGINVFRDTRGATAIPIEKSVRIRFSNSVPKENLLIAKINPFIVACSEEDIKISSERGREIHLSTFLPTDKLNEVYLSQGFISKTNIYKATSGMVWGYMIPSEFAYPAEMISINNVYPNFRNWYESSGNEYTNWYDISVPGNVIKENLYKSK